MTSLQTLDLPSELHKDLSERTIKEERIARRKRIFKRIDEIPVIETPDGFPDAAEIVRQMRDERIEQIAANIGDVR